MAKLFFFQFRNASSSLKQLARKMTSSVEDVPFEITPRTCVNTVTADLMPQKFKLFCNKEFTARMFKEADTEKN